MSDPIARAKIIIPIMVAMIMFVEYLDSSIINTAIPTIARNFAISPILLKYSVASYFLSLSIFLPISGWCADKFGTKTVFLLSVLLFVGASFLCGISQNIWQLTIFRFIQGIGGSFMNPVARIIIFRLFPRDEIIRVQSIIFTPAMLGTVMGPFLGGVITNYLNWHWIFYINIPIGLVVVYLGFKNIEQYIDTQIKPLDTMGFMLAAFSLLAITFFVEMFNHYDVMAKEVVYFIGSLGISVFIIFIIYCLKKTNPVLDMTMFKIRTFSIGLSINLNMYLITAGISFLLPLMYQENFKLSPVVSGFLVLPIAVGYFISRGSVARIINTFGFKNTIWLGILFTALSVLLLGFIRESSSIYFIIAVEFLFGIASVLVRSAVSALAYVDVQPEKLSMATAIDMTFRQFFSSLGIGLTAFFLTSIAGYFKLALFGADAKVLHYTFYVLALCVLLNTISALKLKASDGLNVIKK